MGLDQGWLLRNPGASLGTAGSSSTASARPALASSSLAQHLGDKSSGASGGQERSSTNASTAPSGNSSKRQGAASGTGAAAASSATASLPRSCRAFLHVGPDKRVQGMLVAESITHGTPWTPPAASSSASVAQGQQEHRAQGSAARKTRSPPSAKQTQLQLPSLLTAPAGTAAVGGWSSTIGGPAVAAVPTVATKGTSMHEEHGTAGPEPKRPRLQGLERAGGAVQQEASSTELPGTTATCGEARADGGAGKQGEAALLEPTGDRIQKGEGRSLASAQQQQQKQRQGPGGMPQAGAFSSEVRAAPSAAPAPRKPQIAHAQAACREQLRDPALANPGKDRAGGPARCKALLGVRGLWVAPDLRRKGLGSRLLDVAR